MFIEVSINNGTKYLKLSSCRSGTNSKGNKTIIKRTILNIGPLSRFDDGQPDYIGRLRQSFRDGKPIIPSLVPYASVQGGAGAVHIIKYVDGDPACDGEPKRLAAQILDPLFAALGLDELLASVKYTSRIRYDLQGIVRLLVYGRLLDPASKCATMGQNEEYYRPLVSSSNDDNVYDALTVIHESAQKIFRRMNTCISRGGGRSTSSVFYDVTNFFFEIDDADEDEMQTDDEGNIVVSKGLRKFGVSKENRKQPIVQIGLFMDEGGVPISFEMFPGNSLDHHTLKPAMERTVDSLHLGRFILIADRGMYSGANMCRVADAGNGYIVSKSLRKSTRQSRDWALTQEGYTTVSGNFRYKSRIVTREIVLSAKDGDGKDVKETRKYREKVVVYWSKAFFEREWHEHKSFLEFIKKLKANPAGFRVTAAQSKSLKKFLKKDVLDRKSGEILDGSKLVALIDDEKLDEFTELMGYYQIVTSELDMPDREIIEKYHGLTQIEDQFREMKGTLETRPVFVTTKEHIHAHLIVCFIALTMMRLIQRKIAAMTPKRSRKDVLWSYGMSGARISKALKDWKALEHPGGLFQMLNSSGEDISTILSALGLKLTSKIYTKGELAALKSDVHAF